MTELKKCLQPHMYRSFHPQHPNFCSQLKGELCSATKEDYDACNALHERLADAMEEDEG